MSADPVEMAQHALWDSQSLRATAQRQYRDASEIYRATDEDPADTTGRAMDTARAHYWKTCDVTRYCQRQLDKANRYAMQHRVYGDSGPASMVLAAYSPEGGSGRRSNLAHYGRAGYKMAVWHRTRAYAPR